MVRWTRPLKKKNAILNRQNRTVVILGGLMVEVCDAAPSKLQHLLPDGLARDTSDTCLLSTANAFAKDGLGNTRLMHILAHTISRNIIPQYANMNSGVMVIECNVKIFTF
eukprot:5983474-Amphidinium_carterae.1